RARLTRLETHGSASGDVEPITARAGAIEVECRIGFRKVVVRADLDWPVAGIPHGQFAHSTTAIQFEFAFVDEQFARKHVSALQRDFLPLTPRATAARRRRSSRDRAPPERPHRAGA